MDRAAVNSDHIGKSCIFIRDIISLCPVYGSKHTDPKEKAFAASSAGRSFTGAALVELPGVHTAVFGCHWNHYVFNLSVVCNLSGTLVFRKKLQLRAVITAILILAGVVITIPDFTVNSRYLQGILIGMGSAVSYAVLTTMNKQFTQTYTGSVIAMYEQGIAALLLLPSLLFIKASFTLPDIALLALLGVLMTAVAHTLFISSLKGISAQTAGICSSMETVYGILLAMLVLGEIPSLRECVGAVVILSVVIYSQKTEAAAG